MPQHFSVITVGDATLDTFLDIHEATVTCDINKKNCRLCFNYAEKIPIKKSAQSVGGNAANVAAGLAKLAVKTAIVTELGDDSNGQLIFETLKYAGVKTSFVKKIKKTQSRYSVIMTFQGERTILAYHPPHTYHKPHITAHCDWLYYTSMGKTFETVHAAVQSYLKKNPNTFLALNPGSYQLREGLKEIKEILPRVNFLIVNREEAERIVGKRLLTTNTIEKLLYKLHAQGPQLVVITDGHNGAYAFDGKKHYFQPIIPAMVVSKTGAGDAFAAGMLAALIKKYPLKGALRWGALNAAGVVQHFGAQTGLLTLAKIKKKIQK
jgi:ribokinase